MQGGLRVSVVVRAGSHERLGSDGCPDMGRVENVDPEGFCGVVFHPMVGGSSVAGISTRNLSGVQTQKSPCRPSQIEAIGTPQGMKSGGMKGG